MATFSNLKDLMSYIEKNIPISLEIIGEEIKKILRDNVQQLWYDRPFTPTYYTRTMQYIDSISVDKAVKIGDMYQVSIYFATDLILPYPSENGEWPKHESIYGEDVSAAIPYYIENGNNSPIFNYEGVHPMETTKDWLIETDYVKKRMIQILGSYGYSVQVK